MASRTIKICDWCKKEEVYGYTYKSPEGWRDIRLEFGQHNSRRFNLCPDCSEKLGLVKDNKPVKIEEPDSYEKLFEVISEIVQDVIDKRREFRNEI